MVPALMRLPFTVNGLVRGLLEFICRALVLSTVSVPAIWETTVSYPLLPTISEEELVTVRPAG